MTGNVPRISATSVDSTLTPEAGQADVDVPTRALTPKGYARAVRAFAKLESGAGQNHEHLADFLESTPPASAVQARSSPGPREDAFLTLYRLTRQSIPEQQSQTSVPKLPQVEHFNSCEQFAPVKLPNEDLAESHILIMRGHPTPDWLNLIGSKYTVDPEFFCQHLDFRLPGDESNNYSMPSLPSSLWQLMRLTIITNGRTSGSTKTNQSLRSLGATRLEAHHRKILAHRDVQIGEAMVRRYHILDKDHCSLEQRVSICMQNVGKGFVLLIWLDCGNIVDTTSESLFHATHFLPIIKFKSMIALKAHLLTSKAGNSRRPGQTAAPTAALLHTDFGSFLHPPTMASDAFYALHELFALAAASEMQFLNLLESKIDKFTKSGLDEDSSLKDLKFASDLLFQHTQHVEDLKQCLRNSKHRKWPKAEGRDTRTKADAAADALDQDLQHLQHRVSALHKRCTESITVLMQSIAIKESQEAIAQTRRYGKLTFLAFIFVPLSFTTSFFGMNFAELSGSGPGGSNPLPIWIWFAVSVPMTLLTISLYVINFSTLKKRLGDIKRSRFKSWSLPR